MAGALLACPLRVIDRITFGTKVAHHGTEDPGDGNTAHDDPQDESPGKGQR